MKLSLSHKAVYMGARMQSEKASWRKWRLSWHWKNSLVGDSTGLSCGEKLIWRLGVGRSPAYWRGREKVSAPRAQRPRGECWGQITQDPIRPCGRIFIIISTLREGNTIKVFWAGEWGIKHAFWKRDIHCGKWIEQGEEWVRREHWGGSSPGKRWWQPGLGGWQRGRGEVDWVYT